MATGGAELGRGAALLRSPHETATSVRPVSAPRKYAWWISGRIFLQLLLILALIEAIFVAEKLEGILAFATEYHSPWGDVFSLLMFSAPEVADLALPIGLLVACYVVFLRCREQREFVTLAAAGVDARHFLVFTAAIGLTAQLCSLLISGIVEPYGKFAYRETEFSSRYRALLGDAVPRRFYSFGKYVVMAGLPQTPGTPALFIDEKLSENTDRVTVAHSANLIGPDKDGKRLLQLGDVTNVDLKSIPVLQSHQKTDSVCDDCGPVRLYETSDNVQMKKYSSQITLDDVLRFEPRGLSAAEWSLAYLSSDTPALAVSNPAVLTEIARRFMRSLLCLMSPLLAGLAVSFATLRTQALVLPVASAVLMSIDVTGTTIVKTFSPSVLPVVLVYCCAFAIAAGLIWQTSARIHALLMPAIART